MRYYRITAACLSLAAFLLSSGCSSSTTTTNNDQSTVTMSSQLAASGVSRAMTVKGETPSAVNFDSIVVTSAIVFVKDVKLHSDQDDTTKDDHDQNIKTGPFVLIFDSLGTHVVTTTTVPAGNYDRIKFEIHKPDKSNSADSAVLVSYPQLREANKTYTVAISGYTSRAGIRTYFMVRSSASQNITLKFKDKDNKDRDKLQLAANASSTLLFQFDPRIVFHLLGAIFDPTDPTNQTIIDNNVLVAVRVVAQ